MRDLLRLVSVEKWRLMSLIVSLDSDNALDPSPQAIIDGNCILRIHQQTPKHKQ